MLSNKQSLLLCVFVSLGFCVAGILGILDNFMIASILILAFIAIIVNIVLRKREHLLDSDKDSE
ncbi:hypothetical protein RXV94_09610 [Yeosuana sp. MJ-SS3]|uniref:Uncharacterized protein n=1 Tax=Gilvirhabdus luticola TaxID=3079858 RepID=A0ABU3U7Q1_9FLAO|nr:hypothetical protein [Yeosuana sp. MJ-SS3]MDU8886415.1 hypothetical protein [Yeosuana sp. MJ-SS3]